MKMIRCTALFITAALIGGCAATKVELNQDIKDKIDCVESVSIMPPRVTAVKSKVSGAEELFVLEQQIAAVLKEAAEQAIRDLELDVRDSCLSEEELEANPDLKYELSDLQERFEQVVLSDMQGMVTREKINERHSLGLGVVPFAEMADSDALVFLMSRATVESVGKQMLYAVGGFIVFSPLQVLVGVVDGDDGTIIYAFVTSIMLDSYIKYPANTEETVELREKQRDTMKNELARLIVNALKGDFGPEAEKEEGEKVSFQKAGGYSIIREFPAHADVSAGRN